MLAETHEETSHVLAYFTYVSIKLTIKQNFL